MINQRIYEAEVARPEVHGWETVSPAKEHDFAIKNICAYVGPSMLYDEALNTNYYAILVHDKSRVEEVRDVFSKIEFTKDDFLPCTKLNFYDKTLLVKKYEEALNKSEHSKRT